MNRKFEIQQFINWMLCNISIASIIYHLSEAEEVKFVVQTQC